MLLRIGHLYPQHLNLYGDRGNVLVLQRRLEWRGIASELVEVGLGPCDELEDLDMILIGGGQDREQAFLSEDLRRYKKAALARAIANKTVVLAVCGGFQLLGLYYEAADGQQVPGLELLDLYTQNGSGRLVGNIALRVPTLGGGTVVGYENHGGRTFLGPNLAPLGEVLSGHGNNGRDRGEGVASASVFGTYLHGALLPKNPHLADHLLSLALQRHSASLPALSVDDAWEWAAHKRMLSRLGLTDAGLKPA